MSSAPPRFLGAVLAGGRSRRFGRDKASARVGGVSLVERAAATLEEVLPDVVVVTAPGRSHGGHGRPLVPDLREGCGPLGGIEAALARAEAAGLEGAFALACDLPLVRPQVVRAVLGALGEAAASAPARPSRAGTAGASAEPSCQPLCAAYRVSCLAPARALLDGGTHAVHRLFALVGGVAVPLPEADFLNVNTPHDRVLAELRLSARRG